MNFYQYSLNTAKEKYQKFKSRLDKSISTGKFEKLPKKKKNMLVSRVEKYKKKLERLSLSGKDMAVAGSVAAAMTVSGTTSAQDPGLFFEGGETLNFSCGTTDIAIADLDGDPELEIIGSECSGRIFNSNENGSFTYSSPSALANMSGEFVVGDIDGDDDNDIIFQYGSNFFAAFNDGDGNFTLSSQEYALNPGAFGGESSDSDIDLVDFDTDGDLDLLVATYDSNLNFFQNNGDGVFGAKQNLLNETGLRSFEFVDVDGDLDLDLVYNVFADFDSDEINQGAVRVVENTADYGIIPQLDGASFESYLPNGESVSEIAMFDADGDGDLDIAYSINGGFLRLDMLQSRADEDLPFVFNKFDASGIPFSSSPNDIEVADFDNDGDDDLLVTFSGFYSPYFMSFDGTELVGKDAGAEAGNVREGSWTKTAVGDLDGDGYHDFLGALSGTPTKYIYYDRSFPVFEEVSSGSVIIDENTPIGTSIATLAFFDPNEDPITAYLSGDDAALFSINSTTGDIATTSGLDWEELGSNLDVQLELSDVSKSSIQSLPFKINNQTERGDGVISSEPIALFGKYDPRDFEVGDIDMDGDADLFLSHGRNGPSGGSFSYQNRVFTQGFGAFSEQTSYFVVGAGGELGGGEYSAKNPSLHDVDNDGDLDLIATSSDGRVFLSKNQDGIFDSGTIFREGGELSPSVDVGYDPYGLVLGDFNGDGIKDVAVLGRGEVDIEGTKYYGQNLFSFEGSASGDFSLDVDIVINNDYFPMPLFQGNPNAIGVADFDGDGYDDVFVSVEDSRDQIFYGGEFGLREADRAEVVTKDDYGISEITIKDFNGDGKPDIAIVRAPDEGENALQLDIHLNTSAGAGEFSFDALPSIEVGGEDIVRIVAGDMDGDGSLDIITNTYNYDGETGNYQYNLKVWENDGSGNFYELQTITDVGGREIELMDVDGDDDLDILLDKRFESGGEGGSYSKLVVFENANIAPTGFTLSALAIDEHEPIGTVVGTFSASDQNPNDVLSFSLVAGDGTNDEHNNYFKVVGNELQSNRELRFEDLSSLNINVRVSDGVNVVTQAFTISVNDINQAPTAINLSSTSFDESVAAGSAIATVSATDSNAGDAHEFKFAAGDGTNDADNSKFAIQGNQLILLQSIAQEDQATLIINLQAEDPFGEIVTQALTITVNNVNSTPTAVTLSVDNFNESTPLGTAIATLLAEDVDASDSHTFNLVEGDGTNDLDNGKFAIQGDQLILIQAISDEAESTVSILVEATDSFGESVESALTLTVNNVSNAPTDIELSATSFDENTSGGTAIATLTAVDADASDTHTFQLTSGDGTNDVDNGKFVINGNELVLLAPISAESQTSVNINVSTTDSAGDTFEKPFTLTVNNVNNAPAGVVLSTTSFNENVTAGTSVATLTATDDAGDTNTFILAAGDGTNDADNSKFSISGDQLILVQPVKAEDQGSVNIFITSTDSFGESISVALTLDVINVNNAPTGVALSTTSFDENVTAGTAVSTLTANDDAGDTNTFSLTTGDGTNDADNTKFSISGDQLILVQPVKAENQGSVNIFITSTDSFGESISVALTLDVINVNNAPTGVVLDETSFDETAVAGTVVSTLTANDDAGDTNTFSLTTGDGTNDADNTKFSINGNQLILLQQLAAESQSSVNIYVTATDSFGESASSALTLSVNNVNSIPTGLELSSDSFDEGTAAGTAIATLTAIDADASDTHEYALVSGDGTNDADNGSFIINGDQLIITEQSKFETKSSYNVNISATDSEGSVAQAFVITVNDVNQAPNSISLSTTSINENLNPGATVATVSATDPNASDELTFRLIAGDGSNDVHNSLFTIVGGDLILLDEINFDVLKSININIEVSDGEETLQQSFTLIVNEVLGFAEEVNNTLGIYPNPGNDRLQINLENDLKGRVSIVVSDMSGRVVKEFSINKNQRTLSYPVDMSSAKVGIYLVELRSQQGVISQRWVKQ